MRTRTSLSLVLLVTLVFSGCNLFGGGQNKGADDQMSLFEKQVQSQQKIVPEKFFPKDTLAVVGVSVNEPETKQNLERIVAQFPGVEQLKEAFWTGFRSSGKNNMQEAETLIKELWSETERVTVGVAWTSPEAEPTVYVALVLSKTDAVGKVEAEALKSGGTEENFKDTKILQNPDSTIFGMLKGDMYVVSNQKKALTDLYDRAASDSLYNDFDYRNSVSKLDQPHWVYGYVRFAPLISMISQKVNDPEVRRVLDTDSTRMLDTMAFSLGAQSDGVSLKFFGRGDKAVMDRIGYKFSDLKNPKNEFYLLSKIPALQTVWLEEAYNLKSAFKISFRDNPAFTPEMQSSLMVARQQIETLSGLDLEKDLLDLFGKGAAFAFQYDSGNFMPAMTALIDVSDHETSAKKITGLMDQGFSALKERLAASGAPTTFLDVSTDKLGNSTLALVSVNLNAFVAGNPGIPPAAKDVIAKIKIQFRYGVTDDKLLLLSTIADLPTRQGKNSVMDEENLKKAMTYVDAKGAANIVYFDLSHLLTYVDDIVNVVNDIEPMSTSDRTSYERVVNVLKPIQYAIFTSQTQDYEVVSSGFVKIGK